jgi:hypothetical protein
MASMMMAQQYSSSSEHQGMYTWGRDIVQNVNNISTFKIRRKRCFMYAYIYINIYIYIHA